MIHIGETFEAGIWFSNPLEKSRAEKEIKIAFRQITKTSGIVFSPIVWDILKPGDERVPSPPKEMIEAKLLVGEAKVRVVPQIQVVERSFVADLDFVDAQRLRQITRTAYREVNPEEPELTDDQCDVVIDELGPGIGEGMIRQAVARKRMYH